MPNIEQLDIKISAELSKKTSAEQIDRLTQSLSKLQTIVDNGLGRLGEITQQLAGFSSLADLGQATKGIDKLATSLQSLQAISFAGFSSKITALANGLEPLKNIDISGIANIGRGFNSFSNALVKLQALDLDKLATSIQKIVVAIRPLTDEMLRGGNNASAYGKAMLALAQATKTVDVYSKKAQPNINKLGFSMAKFTGILFSIRRIISFGKDVIQQTASWTENLNLFAVTYGSAYKDTLKWTTDIAGRFGFATNELVKMTGLFKQLSTAIGIANDTGDLMSKTITQLALDFTSFYNISNIQDTVTKLQAGIFSGQTKPLRSLGIDVTYQTLDNLLKTNEALKQFATSSKQLTQAQKAIARLIVTMQAGSNAFGDMSATVDTLQNSMRVMQGSLANLKLAIGDAFASKPALMFYQLVGGIAQGITNIIRAFIPLQTELNRPIEDTFFNELNDDIDETMGKMGLLSFDKFEVLGGGGSSALAENLAITAALTTELKKQQEEYDKIFMASSGIASKAVEIGKTISAWFINVDFEGNFVSWSENILPLVTLLTAVKNVIVSIWQVAQPIGQFAGWIINIVAQFINWIDSVNALIPVLAAIGITWASIKFAQRISEIGQMSIGFDKMTANIQLNKLKVGELTAEIDRQSQIVANNSGIVAKNAQAKLEAAQANLKLESATLKANEAMLKQQKNALALQGVMSMLAGVAGIGAVFNQVGALIGKWDELTVQEKIVQTATIVLTGVMTALAIAQAAAAIAASWGAAAAWIIGGIAVATGAILGVMSMAPKAYATGGIVNYGTTSGDTTLARVNKGEMILNDNQQARLFNMANGDYQGQSQEESFYRALTRVMPQVADEIVSAIRQNRQVELYVDGRKLGETSTVANGVYSRLVTEGKL